MKEKIFLLGGYDLEMIEIKDLFEKNNIKYFDQKLSWENATLDNYTDVLEMYGNDENYEIYGIELRENGLSIPCNNYIRIDHHNELNELPSSLEQVCDILCIGMSRYMHLVAANDRAYIPGMLQLGATEEEIEEIRRNDRKSQGVTENDEKLSEEAVRDKEIIDDIVVVKSMTNRFSAITDRLFPFEKLLIYTQNELMYYGKGKQRLAEMYEDEIINGRIFHGGSEEGYIGTAKSVYSKNSIEKLKEEIITEIKNI